MRRCQRILNPPEFSFNRSVFKSMGFTDDELDKPVIGIANAWSELVPGHYNLRALAQSVKNGIYAAGGTAVEFGVIGACDGTAQGCVGMNYILPSRDLIANDVEIMAQAHQLDGVVMLGSCDKIVPGMMMAAARLRIPAILLPGGPMLGGAEFDDRPSDLTSVSEAVGMLNTGKITRGQFDELEDAAGPSCGSCSFLGTANTMCCLAEAMGLTLPHAALTPAVYADRARLAYRTGEKIVELVNRDIDAGRIITKRSIENGVTTLMAIGGSTNAVMHLTAIASEIDIPAAEMTRMFNEIGDRTPYIAKVNPSSKYNMEDFHRSGGVPQVLYELGDLINRDCLTVTCKTVGENIAGAGVRTGTEAGVGAGYATGAKVCAGVGAGAGGCPRVDRNVIKTADAPFAPSNSVIILRGNIAPEGAVSKPGAIHEDMRRFEGRARVFDREEEAEQAILDGKIVKGDVVVIRYEGPKGGPGMREMLKAMKYLYGRGLGKDTAVITDGRFSGTNNGCFVGHISPEAADGGVIAVIEDGDRIIIDIPGKTLTLDVPDAEIGARMKKWRRPAPKHTKGYLALYERLAASASEGAVIKVK